MTQLFTIVTLLSMPQVSEPPVCAPVLTIQGSSVYCCSMATGQQCCSIEAGSDGKPLGCGC